MADIGPGRPATSLTFDDAVWREEVERFAARSRPRVAGETARRELERSLPASGFKACAADGPDGTRLPKCAKLFVPLGRSGSAAAPYGSSSRRRSPPRSSCVCWPSASVTRRVCAASYERAYKRLHDGIQISRPDLG